MEKIKSFFNLNLCVCIFILQFIAGEEMCFGPLVAEQVNVVSNLQQARVLFYDYYDTGNSSTCFQGKYLNVATEKPTAECLDQQERVQDSP